MIQTTVAPPFLFRMVELKSSYIFEKKRSYSGTKIIYCALDVCCEGCSESWGSSTNVDGVMPRLAGDPVWWTTDGSELSEFWSPFGSK